MSEEYYTYIKKRFKLMAPVYNPMLIFLSRLRHKVVDFTNAEASSKILDIASGTGKQAFAFANKGYDVIGIDLSSDMLKIANKNNKYENLKFQIADVTQMPFKDNQFDVSCSSFGIHEMPLNIMEKALKEMIRVTKKDGIITIVDYAPLDNKFNRQLFYHFAKLFECKYYFDFVKFELETILEKLGIKIEKRLFVFSGIVKIIKGISAN